MSRPKSEHGMPATFDEAEDLGGYTLAARWSDRMSWPLPGDEDVSDELNPIRLVSETGCRYRCGRC